MCSILLEGVDLRIDSMAASFIPVCSANEHIATTRRFDRRVLVGTSRVFCGLTFRGWRRERHKKGCSRDRRWRYVRWYCWTDDERLEYRTALSLRSFFPFSWKYLSTTSGLSAAPIPNDLNVKLATYVKLKLQSRDFTCPWFVSAIISFFSHLSRDFSRYWDSRRRVFFTVGTLPPFSAARNERSISSLSRAPHFYSRNHLSPWAKESVTCRFSGFSFFSVPRSVLHLNSRKILRAINSFWISSGKKKQKLPWKIYIPFFFFFFFIKRKTLKLTSHVRNGTHRRPFKQKISRKLLVELLVTLQNYGGGKG